MSRARTLAGCSLALLALALVPAGSARPDVATRPAAQTADRVAYATSFGNFGRDAYVYAAIEKGYFARENIEVSVSPGAGSVDNIKLVAAGRLDFTPVDIGALVVTRANERVPVRVVSVVHQNTMSAILSLAETGIRRPKDLEGRTIADAPGSTVRVLFPLYARKARIDASRVTFRDAAPPTLPALLASKQVDAVGQFVVGRPLFAATSGKPINALRYSQHLPGLLGIGVVTSEQHIRQNPALVRRFVRALNRGLAYAISNPRDTARILKKHQPLTNESVAAQELQIMRFFVSTRGSRKHGIGYIDTQKMKSTLSVVANGFRLQNRLGFRELYAPGFVKVAAYKPPKKRR